MTKDSFRIFQKIECKSGAPNKAGIYGCSCCRKFASLKDFKKWSRRLARTKLKKQDIYDFKSHMVVGPKNTLAL